MGSSLKGLLGLVSGVLTVAHSYVTVAPKKEGRDKALSSVLLAGGG